MHICIVKKSVIPALKYGGTERVIWWLGKALVNKGHTVTYIVSKTSVCPFGNIVEYNNAIPFNLQIPSNVDIVHLFDSVNEMPVKPYIFTLQGNINESTQLDNNTVFVSCNHANRFGSKVFVHNGIDPEDYGKPDLKNKRKYIHFLADAAWRVKNVKGAIAIARKAYLPLHVIGGYRFNFNMGIRLTFDTNVHFHGMMGGEEKNRILNGSKALLFPVLWHEPFGIAIIESLYFGCPVIATSYGSLPELVPAHLGFLSSKKEELVNALRKLDDYDPVTCNEYVLENFTADKMTDKYISLYEKVLRGEKLNETAPVLKEVQQEKFLSLD